MTTKFPVALDSFPTINGTDLLTSPQHSAQHNNVADAVSALEAKVGVNGSTVTTSLTYQVSQKAGINHTHTGVYAASSHGHTIADVTGLQNALDGKADKTLLDVAEIMRIRGAFDVTSLAADSGLHQVGDVVLATVAGSFAWANPSADLPSAVGIGDAFVYASDNKWHHLGDLVDLSNKSDLGHHHALSEIDGLNAALAAKADASKVEMNLGKPAHDGMIVASTAAGVRYFVDPPTGGSGGGTHTGGITKAEGDAWYAGKALESSAAMKATTYTKAEVDALLTASGKPLVTEVQLPTGAKPASGDGADQYGPFAVAGAAVGDAILVSIREAHNGVTCSGWVTGSGQVAVTAANALGTGFAMAGKHFIITLFKK